MKLGFTLILVFVVMVYGVIKITDVINEPSKKAYKLDIQVKRLTLENLKLDNEYKKKVIKEYDTPKRGK